MFFGQLFKPVNIAFLLMLCLLSGLKIVLYPPELRHRSFITNKTSNTGTPKIINVKNTDEVILIFFIKNNEKIENNHPKNKLPESPKNILF